jgi:hypothetical protein
MAWEQRRRRSEGEEAAEGTCEGGECHRVEIARERNVLGVAELCTALQTLVAAENMCMAENCGSETAKEGISTKIGLCVNPLPSPSRWPAIQLVVVGNRDEGSTLD